MMKPKHKKPHPWRRRLYPAAPAAPKRFTAAQIATVIHQNDVALKKFELMQDTEPTKG